MSHPHEPDARRKNIRTHIASVAMEAFHSKGIKNVTMDDIAHSLTMSKRTLYQLFSDKEDLLLACAMQRDAEECEKMAQLSEQTENVLDLLLRTFAMAMHDMDQIAPSFFAEIIKYPRVVAFFEKNNKKRENEAVEFLNKGIAQGFFRPNVNFRIVYQQLTNGMHSLIKDEPLNQYTQRELFVNTVIPYIRGCATIKGIEIIDKFMDKYEGQIEF